MRRGPALRLYEGFPTRPGPGSNGTPLALNTALIQLHALELGVFDLRKASGWREG